jgi:predicted Zn-dependent protease
MRMAWSRALLVAMIGALGLAGCAATPGDRWPLPGSEIAGDLAERGQAMAFVAVVRQVEPVAEKACRARNPRANCDFRIVVDNRPGMPSNAFQTRMPDGQPVIAFTAALIDDVRNADELAFVMSHEAAHHVLGHLDLIDAIAAQGADLFGRLAAATGETSAAAIRNAQQLGAAVGAQTFSKEFELEADALGTVIAAEAGFDPLVGAEFFFRIPDPGNRFLGTHPPTAERVAVVKRVAAELGFR